MLFRIESGEQSTQILVQTHLEPRWGAAFGDFSILTAPPDYKAFDLHLRKGGVYRFRLLANPTHKQTEEKNNKKHKRRLGYFKQEEQVAWLTRKMESGGAEVLECTTANKGLQRSSKGSSKKDGEQVHLAVLFEGVLCVQDSDRLIEAIESGIGPAKGYGFGLLSLGPENLYSNLE